MPHLNFYVAVTQVVAGFGEGLPVIAGGFADRFDGACNLNVFTAIAFQYFPGFQCFSAFEKYLNFFAVVTGRSQATLFALVVSQGQPGIY